VTFRFLTAAALTGGLLLSVSGAEAATPVMDGKKVRAIDVVRVAKTQANDAEQVTSAVPGKEVDYFACPATKCSLTRFVYKPAKGVKGGLLFTMTWANPLSDFDLYIGKVEKNGTVSEMGDCANVGRASEKFFLAANQLTSGSTYVMSMYYFRSIADDKVTGKIQINVPSTIPTTVPAKADDVADLNCTL
jgi:hypothetical protein